MNDKMENSSLKNKGSLKMGDRKELLQVIRKMSPRKKSNSAKLQIFEDKKFNSIISNSTTLGSEIKLMLKNLVKQKREKKLQSRKNSDINDHIIMPIICEDSAKSPAESNDTSLKYMTMRDIPVVESSILKSQRFQ